MAKRRFPLRSVPLLLVARRCRVCCALQFRRSESCALLLEIHCRHRRYDRADTPSSFATSLREKYYATLQQRYAAAPNALQRLTGARQVGEEWSLKRTWGMKRCRLTAAFRNPEANQTSLRTHGLIRTLSHRRPLRSRAWLRNELFRHLPLAHFFQGFAIDAQCRCWPRQ